MFNTNKGNLPFWYLYLLFFEYFATCGEKCQRSAYRLLRGTRDIMTSYYCNNRKTLSCLEVNFKGRLGVVKVRFSNNWRISLGISLKILQF